MINFIIGGICGVMLMCLLQINRINKMQNRIDKAIDKLKEHKCDLDYEPWSFYKINGSILFDLVGILGGDVDDE